MKYRARQGAGQETSGRSGGEGTGTPRNTPTGRTLTGWAPTLALLVGAAGLIAGAIALVALPQRPDGDLTAVARFHSQYGASTLHDVRHAPWWNVAGALFAWGALDRLLRHLLAHPAPRGQAGVARAGLTLAWMGVLVAWSGWAWNQTRGWQGELFMEQGVEIPLGVDRDPRVTFQGFLIPPAPDGPGRALALHLDIDGAPHELASTSPYRARGWTIVPRWYGMTVDAPALESPLFFGGSGVQEGALQQGGATRITLDMERGQASAAPPVAALSARYHAILSARFAPGDSLLRVGAALFLAGGLLPLAARGYNLRKRAAPGIGARARTGGEG